MSARPNRTTSSGWPTTLQRSPSKRVPSDSLGRRLSLTSKRTQTWPEYAWDRLTKGPGEFWDWFTKGPKGSTWERVKWKTPFVDKPPSCYEQISTAASAFGGWVRDTAAPWVWDVGSAICTGKPYTEADDPSTTENERRRGLLRKRTSSLSKHSRSAPGETSVVTTTSSGSGPQQTAGSVLVRTQIPTYCEPSHGYTTYGFTWKGLYKLDGTGATAEWRLIKAFEPDPKDRGRKFRATRTEDSTMISQLDGKNVPGAWHHDDYLSRLVDTVESSGPGLIPPDSSSSAAHG